jgi:O-antigen ligase
MTSGAMTMVPSATLNALMSLLIPAAVLVAMASLTSQERKAIQPIVIALIFCAALLGLFQISVGHFDNPLINDTPWQVSGPFANRNHFALFMAFGCLLVPAWIFGEGRSLGAGHALGLLLMVLFLLMILVSGSRAGLLTGALATAIGLLLARQAIRKQLRHAPQWMLPSILAAVISLGLFFILVSVRVGRAVSIERIVGQQFEDMRSRSLSTVLTMVKSYFPAGSGIGSFDTVFRIHEPFELLKATYFNHAHNDFLEIAIDTGLPGILLMLIGLIWWAWASLRVWRAGSSESQLGKLGSAMLLLVFVGSAFDYPARAPIVMAMVVIAAVWLERCSNEIARSALPRRDQHL